MFEGEIQKVREGTRPSRVKCGGEHGEQERTQNIDGKSAGLQSLIKRRKKESQNEGEKELIA